MPTAGIRWLKAGKGNGPKENKTSNDLRLPSPDLVRQSCALERVRREVFIIKCCIKIGDPHVFYSTIKDIRLLMDKL